MLLYTNYLQEVNLYKNKLQMNDFKVNLKTYKFLQNSSLINQQSIKSMLSKDTSVSQRKVDNLIDPQSNLESPAKFDLKRNRLLKRGHNQLENEIDSDFFYLNPPFPKIELFSIGPVFIENGLVYVYCEYTFDTIKCTVSGIILGKKSYLATTQFKNLNFQLINVIFDVEFIKLFFGFHSPKNSSLKHEHNTILYSVVSKNLENINLFSNYIMLFGSNGTNIDLFTNDFQVNNQKENFLNDKYKFYQFIQAQVSFLFLLINIKLINYLLLLVNFTFSYVMHFPIYIFGRIITNKASNDEESSITQHWIMDQHIELPGSQTMTLNSSLSSGNNKLIKSSTAISRQRSSIMTNNSPHSIPIDRINEFLTEELNPINNKYQLLYSFIIIHFLIHIIIYHLVNMITQNSINDIFSKLYLSSSDKIIDSPPHGLISIMFSGIGPNTFQMSPGSALFSHVMNIIKCFANITISLFFHGLYCIVLYSLTFQ